MAQCQATFKEHCQYPKCDCDRHCHKCGLVADEVNTLQNYLPSHPGIFFHSGCFKPHDHYYGLNKPID